jgi:hypothetical protein
MTWKAREGYDNSKLSLRPLYFFTFPQLGSSNVCTLPGLFLPEFLVLSQGLQLEVAAQILVLC